MPRRVSSPAMVGRRAEMARLHAALESVADGTPAAVVVHGEAGVGKSRLAREFTGRARERGVAVWEGRCVPLTGGRLPYVPVVDVLRAVAADIGLVRLRKAAGGAAGRLAMLLPTLAPVEGGGLDDGHAFPRLYADLVDLVEGLTADRTAIVVLEDVHWADPSTRALLGALVGGQRHGRLLLICTYRDGELPADHPVPQLLGEWVRAGVERIALQPLALADTAALMAAILGGTPDRESVARTFTRSGGNPFLVEELLAAGPDDGGVAGSLRDVLLQRTRRVSPPAQAILRIVALSGRGVDQDLLERVVGVPAEQVLGGLRTAVDEHILVVEGDRYSFRHALVAEALAADLLPGERARLHRAFAEALTARAAALATPSAVAAHQAELAHHWSGGGDSGAALVAAVAAGLAAEQAYAVPEARLNFEHALRLWHEAPQAHDEVALGLAGLYQHAAEAANLAGDVDAALTYVRQAIDCVGDDDPSRLGILHERLGRYLRLSTGAASVMIGAYETAVALVPAEAGRARARVLAGLASGLLLAGRLREAREWAEQALEVAVTGDARPEEVHILSTLGCVLADLGEPEMGIARLRRAVRLGSELDDLDTTLRAYTNLSNTLFVSGRLTESAEVALRGAERAGRRGATRSFGRVLRGNAAEALFYLGRWDDVSALLPETATYDGNPMQCIVLGHAVALLRTAQGRFEEAEEHLDVARRALAPDGILERQAMLEAAVAELRLWQGRPAEALAAAAAGLQTAGDADLSTMSARLLAAAARAHADLAAASGPSPAVNDSTYDLASVTALAARLLKQPTITPVAAAHLAQAQAELARVRHPGDAQPWATAMQAWSTLRCPYPLAYVLWRQAEALSTDRTTSTKTIQAAYQTAASLGARPLCTALEHLSQRRRMPLRPGSAEPPRSDPAAELGLTRRELDVLRLIGHGYTNRQIATTLWISEKTVSIHVSRVLTKLNVSNRATAAVLAHRRGLLTTSDGGGPVTPGD